MILNVARNGMGWLTALFDAKVEAGTSRAAQGIVLTGHFNWLSQTPWMLAGGLDPKTVGKAVAISGARAVDVSSGVEASLRKKDAAKIHAFIRAAQLV